MIVLVQTPTRNGYVHFVREFDSSLLLQADDGTNILYSTTDAGQSWTKVDSEDLQFSELDFISSSIGWAISGELLYQTLDSGHKWSQVYP